MAKAPWSCSLRVKQCGLTHQVLQAGFNLVTLADALSPNPRVGAVAAVDRGKTLGHVGRGRVQRNMRAPHKAVQSPAPVTISHMYTALHRLPSVICTQPCTGCDQSWNTKMPHVHMLGAASRDTPRRQPGSLPSRIARLDDCTREQAVVSPSLFRQIVKSKGHAIERTCSRLSHTVL